MSGDGETDETGAALWRALCAGVRPLRGKAAGVVDAESRGLSTARFSRVLPAALRPRIARPNLQNLLMNLSARGQRVLSSRGERLLLRDQPRVFAALDGRRARRLRSGKLKPDAVLDLHGQTVLEASEKFANFFANSRRRDARCLLVITGKGAGVLQKALAGWLETSEVRDHLAGVSALPLKKGGQGAWMLYLRRNSRR